MTAVNTKIIDMIILNGILCALLIFCETGGRREDIQHSEVWREREENLAHILCECEALASLRLAYLGSFFLEPEDIKSLGLGANWNFSKITGLPWFDVGHKGPVIKAYVHRGCEVPNPNANQSINQWSPATWAATTFVCSLLNCLVGKRLLINCVAHRERLWTMYRLSGCKMCCHNALQIVASGRFPSYRGMRFPYWSVPCRRRNSLPCWLTHLTSECTGVGM